MQKQIWLVLALMAGLWFVPTTGFSKNRQEALRDTPITTTVLSAEDMEKMSSLNPQDLINNLPNMVQPDTVNWNQTNVNLRGLSSSSTINGANQAGTGTPFVPRSLTQIDGRLLSEDSFLSTNPNGFGAPISDGFRNNNQLTYGDPFSFDGQFKLDPKVDNSLNNLFPETTSPFNPNPLSDDFSNFFPEDSITKGLNTTESIYTRDRWQLNDNWSFNIGFRYEDIESTPVPEDLRLPPFLRNSGSFGTGQLPGESAGLIGPSVACGRVNNECTLAFYDASGAFVGSVTNNQLQDDPFRTTNLLNAAQQRSQNYFSQTGSIFSPNNFGEPFGYGSEPTISNAPSSSSGVNDDPLKPLRLAAIKQIEDLIASGQGTDAHRRMLNDLRGLPPGFVGQATDLNGDGLADIVSGINMDFPGLNGTTHNSVVNPTNNFNTAFGPIFADGFESGDTSSWTDSNGSSSGSGAKSSTASTENSTPPNDQPFRYNAAGVNRAPLESTTVACSAPSSLEQKRQEILDKYKGTGDIAGAARELAELGGLQYDQTGSQALSQQARAIANETGRNYDEVLDELQSEYLAHGDNWLTATKGNCYEFVHLAGWMAGSGEADYRQFQGGLASLIDPQRMMAWDGKSEIPAGQVIVGRSSWGGQDSYDFYHTAVSLGNGLVANNRGDGVQIEKIEDVFGAYYTNPLTGKGIYYGSYRGYNIPRSAALFLDNEKINNMNNSDLTPEQIANRNTIIDSFTGGGLLDSSAFTDDGRTYFNFLKQAVDGYTNHTPYFLTNFNRWKAANPNQVVSSFSTTTNESTTHFQHGTEHLAERHEAETWEDAAANAFGNIMLGEQVEGLQNQLAESQRQLQSLIKKYGANHEGTAPARRILQSTIDSTKKQLDDLGAPQVAPAHPTYNSPDNYQPSFRAHPIPEADRAKIREQIQNFYGSNQVTPTNNQTGFPGIFSQNVFDNPGILNQDFSATTKLDGTDTVFGDRVRLNFDTSFTGEDRLRTRLDSGSTNAFNSFGNESAFNDPIGSYQNFNGAFNPSAVTALRLGMGPGDNAHLAGILNSTLSCRRTGYGSDCFEVLVKCKVYIYVTEEGIIYVVADKNKEAAEITPNDPYYLKQEEKKKKLLGIFGSSKKAEKPVFGLGMKFGTGTMGDGESYDSANKKEPTAVDQWGLHAIGYLPKDDPNSAWNLVGNVDINKKNITIAVIDSGLDTTHPDGPTHVWTNKNEIPNNGIDDDHNGYIDDVHGWNFLEENNDLTDYKGHGTFVSGIIAAKANNGIGIAGINPGAEIMPLKVTNEEGEANTFHIARAVRYAADNGARIINLSIAGDGVSQILQLAFNYAERKGVFVVVASGNENLSTENYGPVANQHVTAVGATNIDGTRASISSWGPNNALLGPGEEIWSLRSKDSFNKRSTGKEYWEYYPQSGTSFSTPMAAATASLLLVKYPGLTAKQLEDILLSTADEMYDPGWDDKSGAGMMNASAALNFDPEKIFNVKIDKVRINRNEKDKPETVDIFGTVQGNIQSFHVELGKTFRAKKFKQVAGPFNVPANNAWIARIPVEEFKGNKEWLLRINATHKDGTVKYATTEVNLR